MLSFSTLFWLLLIPVIAEEPDLGGIIVLIVVTAPPVCLGIYGIRRGLRRKLVKETSDEPMPAGKDPETLLRQKERTVAQLRVGQFSRLSWLIVIAFPILAIVVAIVFQILDLSVWLLILTLLIVFVIVLLLLGLVSKHQAIYFKKSSSSDLAMDEHEREKGAGTAK